LAHKKSLIFALALLLLISPLIVCAITLNRALPDNLCTTKGSVCTIGIGRLVGTDFCADKMSVLATGAEQKPFAKEENGNLTLFTEAVGQYDIELKFLGVLPVKRMSVNVIEDEMLIPGGESIGIKIHTDGLIVVRISSVQTDDGQNLTPAKEAGLKEADIIMKAGGEKVKNSEHFSSLINEKGAGGIELEIMRDNQPHTLKLTPVLTGDGYKIGAWVRDSSAGIGTLTFVKPDTKVFASLGHGISDTDTSLLLDVGQGSITDCKIVSVKRGQKGTPGELRGIFEGNDTGVISQNSSIGVYGVYDDVKALDKTPRKIASRFETREGKATIICTVDTNGPTEYDIEIEKVMTNSTDAKGMIVKVTDERLLEKTGGIVQGMSGSPILQNGKIVGAVTHVFVNDPTRGYGIFIENMLSEVEKIK